MTHPVLARQWRPQQFKDMIGQGHVIQALQNALIQQRLHHAYLFTGTRGVGKTTIARILAKCLNCQPEITATPCDECASCQAISQGQAIDVIEVDAASRTKVEDTRELLDNLQYAPTQSRFKIYIIDEVHMLSKHSFNALLKTLEEPPPHAKFILATTDPQKLPVTVLSRCLHFHMKTLAPKLIAEHLATVLRALNIPFEFPALQLIASAAQGSVRDGLSILDQAIAYTANNLTTETVRDLLGTIAFDHVHALLTALAQHSGESLLNTINQLAEIGTDFNAVLTELIHTLHQVSVLQIVPTAYADISNRDSLVTLSQQFTPELMQLYYQIALQGQQDINLAPNSRLGFEMTLLRMLAFMPVNHDGTTQTPPTPQKITQPTIPSTITAPSTHTPDEVTKQSPTTAPLDWAHLITQLNLRGATLLLAQQCELQSYHQQHFEFNLAKTQAALLNTLQKQRLTESLQQHLQQDISVNINLQDNVVDSPAIIQQQEYNAAQQKAAQQLADDPTLNKILNEFNGRIIPDTIENLSTMEQQEKPL